MAFDVFLKLADIDGESVNDKHKNEIDVLSYSWLVGPAPSATAPAQLTALVVNKNVDAASPELFDAACMVRTIPTGRLSVLQAGGDQTEVLRLEMTNIKVIRMTPQWSTGGTAPVESIQLQFTGAKMDVADIDPATGKTRGTISATCGS